MALGLGGLGGMGGMNPKQMQKLMNQMGIKSEEIPAEKVTIEKADGSKIVIESPSVTAIEMGGQKSFQIAGNVSEEKGEGAGSAGQNDDAALVMKETGASRAQAEKALDDSDGDIATAIMSLQK